MSLSFIINSAFELGEKLSNFVFSSLSIFLNTKTGVVTNLNLVNSENNFFSLFLFAVQYL